jgi:hypothetical protein
MITGTEKYCKGHVVRATFGRVKEVAALRGIAIVTNYI